MVGVALGVAAVVAVNVANHSARESFLAASAVMESAASHVIVGEPSDQLFRQIRLTTDYPAQPIVQGQIRVMNTDELAATIYGLDPISAWQFTTDVDSFAAKIRNASQQLLEEPFSVLVTADTLRRLHTEIGATINIRFGSEHYRFRIAGLIDTDTPLAEQSFRMKLLTDIATAQTVLNMRGQLSSIQLQLPADDQAMMKIKSMLPRDTQLEGQLNRQLAMASITEAFQTNLTAMSLLTVLVAMFLVYNAMNFLVMRRQPTIRTMRALGVSRTEMGFCLVLEAIALGLVASMIGFIIGSQLAKLLLLLVERSIDTLYFPVDAGITILSPFTFVLALSLGAGATLLAALPALREALHTKPSFSTGQQSSYINGRKFMMFSWLAGGSCVVLGWAILHFFPTHLIGGFTGIYLIVAGYFCLVPTLGKFLYQFIRAFVKHYFGMRGILATRALAMTDGKTCIAICAICIAISATIGVGIMISSFRTAVEGWLGDRLSADIYITTPGPGDQLSVAEISRLQALSGVEFVGMGNWTWLQSKGGKTRIFAVDYGERTLDGYRLKAQIADIWKRFQSGGVIVSEPYAWRYGVETGDLLNLWNSEATVQVPVLGVFFDYSSDRGIVVMHRNAYIANFGDRTLTTAALFSHAEVDLQELENAASQLMTTPGVNIWSAYHLYNASMDVFDQTFTVTTVLQSLAVIVAIVAVISTLAMVQMTRRRELRAQNAIGFTTREIWGLASIESGLMGLVAGVLSIPVGLILSWLLIWVVNQRSFGWTMQLLIDSSILLEAVALSVIVALLAGIIPAAWLATRVPKQLAHPE